MRTSLGALLGLSLLTLVGCQNRAQRSIDEQREASEKTAQAEQQMNRGELDKARKSEHQATDEKMKAAEDRAAASSERVPVAGHDWTPMERSLSTELGDDWRIERSANGLTAARTRLKVPDVRMTEKVNDAFKSLRDDHKMVSGKLAGDVVWLRGSADSCDDAAGYADKFAKIDGVNTIHVMVSCTVK